ncbi:hypothetical protein [Methanobacterium ferruginis]|uniref:hypothetical protein n=1 Tax=Methanobacterium ferruginis TaxID=710191 RepID=UPI002573B854|nr:hypothetical protein [Methanobacterium ferruginis]BDZ68591.1 hypothetical protein GCM10025860_20390 [Methanobacterium ferruginis]
MTVRSDDYIILSNPNHPESDFRLNNKGDINIIGTTNHGAGVKARRGLLRGSGKSDDIDYLFDASKFTEETAQEWLDNYMEKSIMNKTLLNKNFSFTMPLIKGYTGEDGFYHIQFGLSTTVKDLQNDEISDKALDEMVEELKSVQIAINDGHNHKLKDLIGPTTKAWREGTDMFVDLRVRKMWEEEIKDLIASETPLGGSIEGKATKSIISKSGKPLIDGVKLYGGALTDIPAAWNLRGTAREKTCAGSLCGQLKKSLGIETLEANNVKKSVINVEEAYESIRNDINEALDKKYGQMMEGGWIDRKCYLRYTMPDSIVVATYSGDLYQMPYSRTTETGEVKLSDPIPATNQIVTKMIEDANWTIKSNKPNGGGNLTKTEDKIPEGMDEKFVDKIKALGDEGKTFLKGLLGVEDESKDPTGDPGGNPNPATGGMKKMIPMDDVKKMIEDSNEEIRKEFKGELKSKDNEISSLKKTVDNREKTISDQEHDDLVDKAIKKTQKMGNEDVKTEEDLMKHLQKEEEFTEEELEENPDSCIKTAMRGWKVASKYIPSGKLPRTDENEMQKMSDKHAEKATEIRKSLAERGTK